MNREKTFSWEFTPIYNYALEYNAQYQHHTEGEKRHQEDKERWQEEMNRLSELSAKGTIVDGFTWAKMDKQLEELNVSKSSKQLGKERLVYTLQLTVEKLFGYYNDIREEYDARNLTLDQYRKYLTSYKDVIASGNGLECYKTPIAKLILAAIKDHLPSSN